MLLLLLLCGGLVPVVLYVVDFVVVCWLGTCAWSCVVVVVVWWVGT